MIRFCVLLCSLIEFLLLAPVVLAERPSHLRMPDGEDAPEGMQAINTPEYTVYSDLPKPLLDEVLHRLERMVFEYRDRTDFLSDNRDDRKLPLYLFSNRD